MEKLSNSSHFLDLSSLDSLRSKAQQDSKGALKEVAQQFEGIFVQMLMKSMRDANAVFESDSPMNSQYTKFYEQMHDQQMSMDLSDKGMLGLADLMVQQLDPDSSQLMPASGLRGNMSPVQKASMAVEISDPRPSKAMNITAQSNASQYAASNLELQQVLSGEIKPSMAIVKDKLNFESPNDFVTQLYPHAKKAADTLGTTPELLIAQSALETGWGQKVIKTSAGESSHNLFNIKADKRWSGEKSQVNTLEYEQGRAVKQKADFRVYEGIEQSFHDFVSFISNNSRYQEAQKLADKPEQFIRALQQAGYATDPQYANKVIKVMKTIVQEVNMMANGGGE